MATTFKQYVRENGKDSVAQFLRKWNECAVKGYSQEDIAKEMELPEDTVKMVVGGIRNGLRLQIKERHPSADKEKLGELLNVHVKKLRRGRSKSSGMGDLWDMILGPAEDNANKPNDAESDGD